MWIPDSTKARSAGVLGLYLFLGSDVLVSAPTRLRVRSTISGGSISEHNRKAISHYS